MIMGYLRSKINKYSDITPSDAEWCLIDKPVTGNCSLINSLVPFLTWAPLPVVEGPVEKHLFSRRTAALGQDFISSRNFTPRLELREMKHMSTQETTQIFLAALFLTS